MAAELGRTPRVCLDRALAWIGTYLIRAYQRVLSPLMGGQCRFYPTCSHYALGAIERHGGSRGVWLAVKRVMRCHPWHPGGEDPVPEPRPGRC